MSYPTDQRPDAMAGCSTQSAPSSSSMQMSRQPRGEYSSMPAPDQPGADGSRPRHGFSSPQYPIAGSRHAQEDPRSLQAVQPYFDGRSSGQMPPTQAGPNQRIPPGMQPPQQPMQDERAPLQRDFETPYRGAPAGPTPPPVPFNDSQRGDLPSGTRNGPPPPNFNGASSNNYDPQGQFPAQPPSQLPIRRHTPNIPWRNPSAFPAEIYERFSCHSDDANHVFRIDLSPVFAEKATKLSELNQYIWAWPFILECCGNDTHFAFDHFQFKRNTETDMPELAYVGELQLSMASFNSYLEKYLSNVPGKDVVVLEDHVTKKTITIVASENIIALNNLVLARLRAAAPAPVDRGVVAQRQAQMVLFLESILPCLDAIVEEAYELGLSSTDDSDEFRKVFDDESMWRTVDADLRDPPADNADNYSCGICEREITNLYKQCLGCAVYSRRCRPNMAFPIFRICLRCHSQPEQHHFKPRAIASYYDKVLSSEGHTGILPATRRYQSVRSYFKCRCVPSNRCAHCGGCESCSCLCHTLYQTRFRFTAPGT
ncbi:Like-Sm (LSM) domain containing protein, LSm4/SmD1/SmD3 [Phytophthora cactorum]|nr:Like-Sm (LSM) domain containing protein, LSm4/SmD1/SmD3 [Phytophthora cactorum]